MAERPALATALLTLSLLLERGIPLPDALTAVAAETRDDALAGKLKAAAASLESGDIEDAKTAFEKAGIALPPNGAAYLEAGELSGLLDVFVGRLGVEIAREGGATPASERALALRVLGVLLTAGIEMDQALSLAAAIPAAPDVSGALREGKGRTLAECLRAFSKLLPEPFGELLAEAERADSTSRSSTTTNVSSLLDFYSAGLEQGWLPLDASAPRPFLQELRTFYRVLHLAIAGRPFDRALELTAKAPVGAALAKAITSVRADIDARESAVESLLKHPAVFAPSFVALLRSVEEQDAPLDYVMATVNEGVDRGLFVPKA